MAYDTVIRMCDTLSLNPVDFSRLEEGNELSAQLSTKRVMEKYNRLNRTGRRKIMEFMDDYAKIPEYVEEE